MNWTARGAPIRGCDEEAHHAAGRHPGVVEGLLQHAALRAWARPLALRHVYQGHAARPVEEPAIMIDGRLWARFLRWCHLTWHGPGMFSGSVHIAVTWRGDAKFVPWGSFGWTMERGKLHVECECGRSW